MNPIAHTAFATLVLALALAVAGCGDDDDDGDADAIQACSGTPHSCCVEFSDVGYSAECIDGTWQCTTGSREACSSGPSSCSVFGKTELCCDDAGYYVYAGCYSPSQVECSATASRSQTCAEPSCGEAAPIECCDASGERSEAVCEADTFWMCPREHRPALVGEPCP